MHLEVLGQPSNSACRTGFGPPIGQQKPELLHRLDDPYCLAPHLNISSFSLLQQRATFHTFRHSLAADMIEPGSGIRSVQKLLRHRGVKTTMIYTHVLDRAAQGVRSQVDMLWVLRLLRGNHVRPRGGAPVHVTP